MKKYELNYFFNRGYYYLKGKNVESGREVIYISLRGVIDILVGELEEERMKLKVYFKDYEMDYNGTMSFSEEESVQEFINKVNTIVGYYRRE